MQIPAYFRDCIWPCANQLALDVRLYSDSYLGRLWFHAQVAQEMLLQQLVRYVWTTFLHIEPMRQAIRNLPDPW